MLGSVGARLSKTARIRASLLSTIRAALPDKNPPMVRLTRKNCPKSHASGSARRRKSLTSAACRADDDESPAENESVMLLGEARWISGAPHSG